MIVKIFKDLAIDNHYILRKDDGSYLATADTLEEAREFSKALIANELNREQFIEEVN